MSKRIIYYFPMTEKKNKAGNANLTIDWFKKQFKLPLDLTVFTELNYIDEGAGFETPNLKDVMAFTNDTLILQGEVEKIIRQRTFDDGDIVRVLLSPIK